MLKCVGMSVYMFGFMVIIVCVFWACIYVKINLYAACRNVWVCANESVYGVHVSRLRVDMCVHFWRLHVSATCV